MQSLFGLGQHSVELNAERDANKEETNNGTDN